MSYIYKQYIDGDWLDAGNGGTWKVINPATEDVVREVPFGDGSDCKAAIDAAARAFPDWSSRTAYERAGILRKAADLMRERAGELAKTTVQECGKPMAQAKGEWVIAADLFEWFSEECKRAYGRTIPSRRPAKRLLVLKQPIGVVGIITAWNFPAYNTSRAWAAALAAGCTVVARPSELTPLTAMDITNILVEAGIPSGVMNLINGEPESMGQMMLDHSECRKISFTGSVRVGRILLDGASRTFTRLSLELGGNAPVLIFPDADISALAKSAVGIKYRNAGQVCTSPQRFLIHRGVSDEFAERLVPNVEALTIGDGLRPETDVGPMINAKQRERVEAMVAEARGEGVEVLTGGGRPEGFDKGYFYRPTVLNQVDPSVAIYHEEIFGPVLPLSTFDDADEAIELANRTRYGLASYVWTNDMKTAVRCYEGLEFGMVGVNDWTVAATEGPFPGWKQSGMGHESGQEGLDNYLETKLVNLGV
ncbi:MAG: NAD-dependent succinate-semialdehyde dehydrogenase [Vicinamibacteria bacterium]